jgi:hypothetical protein
MTIDFTCQKCDSSFEIDVQDLIDGSEKLVCPNCDAKASTTLTDDFIAALTEMRAQVAALGKKFTVNLAVESEDADDLDEEDDDDEEEADDEDELDFDEADDEDEELDEEEP